VYLHVYVSLGSSDIETNSTKGQQATATSSCSYEVFSLATICYTLQVSLVYWASTYFKTGPEWRVTHTATYYALSLHYFQMPLGALMLQLPKHLLQWMTASVLWWEEYGPLFFFIPVKSQACRLFGVLGFLALHLGFALCLRLGVFFWIGVVGNLMLLPALAWEILHYCFVHRTKTLEVYYDHDVPLFRFLATHLEALLPTYHIELHSQGCNQEVQEKDEERAVGKQARHFVIQQESSVYEGDKAIIFISSHSRWLFWITPLLHSTARVMPVSSVLLLGLRFFARKNMPYFLGQSSPMFYIARKRARAGKGIPLGRKVKFALGCFFFFFLFASTTIILLWNFNDIHVFETSATFWDNGARTFAVALHLDQQWAMFSPGPPTEDWWFMMEGYLDDGTHVELFHNRGT